MSQIVEIPGYGTAEFPDDMSQADMAAAIKRKFMPKVSPAEDYSKAAGSGAVEGVKDVVGTTVSMLPKTGAMGPAAQTFAPGTNMFLDAASALAKRYLPSYQPQSTGAKYVQEGTRGAVSGSIGGPMGALSGATAGMGGEAGSQFTHGATINVPGVGPIDYGRAAGSFIGGLIPNIPSLVGNYAGSKIRNATQGMTDAEWAAAQQRQAQANQQGILVTGPEALNNKDLLAQQLVAEQHPKSSQIMAEYMKNRGGQVQQATKGVLDTVGAPSADPRLTGAGIQQAAADTLERGRKYAGAQARPSYNASVIPGESIAPDINSVPDALKNNVIVRDAINTVRNDPKWGINKTESNYSTVTLDAAQKQLADAIEGAKKVDAHGQAALLTGARKQILAAMEEHNPDYAVARRAYERGTAAQVTPRENGTIGQVASSGEPTTQFAAITNPKLSTPSTVSQAAKDLKVKNPEQFQTFVRTGLEGEFDAAMKNMQGTGQEFAGARFARQMRDTPQTRANIEALISELPDGKTRLKAFNNLVDTLELTGNRIPTGSRTAFNDLQIDQMTSAGLNAMKNPATAATKWYANIAQGLTAKQLAQVFTDPNSVALMRKLAFEKPGSDRARAVISVIAGYKKPESPEDENK